MHELLMPKILARARVERDERVREEVVALAVAAEEVVSRRAERNECDAVLGVDRELAPVVDAAAGLIVILGPGVVADFARTRNALEGPDVLARHDVVGVHVVRRRAITRALGGQRNDE